MSAFTPFSSPPLRAAGLRSGLTARRLAAAVAILLALLWLAVVLTHHNQVETVVLGVDTGGLIAAIALSATLTFRGSGVVNFSVAAMAMFASFIFYDLWQNGAIFFPPPLGTWTLHAPPPGTLGGQPPAMGIWVAFGLTLGICGILGLLFHLCIFRPLRHAPVLARVAASIGLYLVLFATVTIRFPASSGYSFPTLLPQGTWTVGGVIIPQDQAVMVLIVTAVAMGLWAVFRYTRFGLAMRAAAENERGAQILGYNPYRFAAITWVVSTMLAGAFGLLLASIETTITPYQVTLLIVPALAAALVGRFRSFPVVLAAALIFGATQQWILAVSSESWFPSWLTSQGSALPGLSTVIPLAVILVVLFVSGERLPSRGSDEALRMPRAEAPRHAFAFSVVLFALITVGAFTLNPVWRIALATSVIAMVMCLSLTVLTGFTGQVSLMQMTIGGVSAFVLSKICDVHHIAFPLGPLLAALAGTVVGLLAAIPALRIRGVHLAIATLAAAVAIEQFVYNLPVFQSGYTAASQATIAAPRLPGTNVTFGPLSWPGWVQDPFFEVFCGVVLVVVVAGVVHLRRTTLGRRMLAVRSNERAAAAIGINVARTKVAAFAISAFIAGVAGTMFGYAIGGVDTSTFSSLDSLLLIAIAYLGGIALWEGAIVSGLIFPAGVIALFLGNVLHVNVEYDVYVAGIGLIVTSLFNQEGIAGSTRMLVAHRRRRPPVTAAPDSVRRPPVAPPRPVGVASGWS